MEYQGWFKKLTKTLLALSVVFATSAGCHSFWGEVEVPECMRAELEDYGEKNG